MKTQRKNKNKLTKRSNKKNKQNKKTQKRKQSGGNTSSRLSRVKARAESVATSALTSAMKLNCIKNIDDCEVFIKLLIKKYEKKYDSMTDHEKGERVSKNNYVRTKVCRKISKQIYMPGKKPKEILDFLKNLYDQNCDKSSQRSMNSGLNLSM